MYSSTGFWNFTEPVRYRVLKVEFLFVPGQTLHWQNAVVGTEGQVVEITRGAHTFYIDNRDGSGIRKLEVGGGPDRMHRTVGKCRVISVVPEFEINLWDPVMCEKLEGEYHAWALENHPDEYSKLQVLIEKMPAMQNGTPHQ